MGPTALTHPAWCAGGHRCGLGEHRSDPQVVQVVGVGRAVLTRVQAATGRQHAEVLLRIELADDEGRARWQLGTLLTGMGRVLGRARLVGHGAGRTAG